MKKIVLTALSASLLISGINSVGAEGTYTAPSQETIAIKQSESTAMRTKYYNEYKAKGYDMAPLEAYLDASKTSDGEFWAAFKVIKDKKEIPDRRAHVAKLQSKGYDVSRFTEEVINDAGKFWETVKLVEYGTKPTTTEVKKEEYKKPVEVKKEEYKNEEVKAKVEEKKAEVTKKVEEKKEEVKAKVEEKKTQVTAKISQAQTERLTKLMKDRIAKIPADKRDATLASLETALKSGIESARAKGAKLLLARYEVLLSVVQEEMNNVDDETLINSLFQ